MKLNGVETDKGTIECEQVVVGAGPWARDFWNMLELPKTANIKGKDGKMHETDMWTYCIGFLEFFGIFGFFDFFG